MVKAYRSHDGILSDTLTELKRHLGSCRSCSTARKAMNPETMCHDGMNLVLRSAEMYDTVIKLRIAAYKSPDNTVIPCPDPGKHGMSYSLTAVPVLVIGFQGKLF